MRPSHLHRNLLPTRLKPEVADLPVEPVDPADVAADHSGVSRFDKSITISIKGLKSLVKILSNKTMLLDYQLEKWGSVFVGYPGWITHRTVIKEKIGMPMMYCCKPGHYSLRLFSSVNWGKSFQGNRAGTKFCYDFSSPHRFLAHLCTCFFQCFISSSTRYMSMEQNFEIK